MQEHSNEKSTLILNHFQPSDLLKWNTSTTKSGLTHKFLFELSDKDIIDTYKSIKSYDLSSTTVSCYIDLAVKYFKYTYGDNFTIVVPGGRLSNLLRQYNDSRVITKINSTRISEVKANKRRQRASELYKPYIDGNIRLIKDRVILFDDSIFSGSTLLSIKDELTIHRKEIIGCYSLFGFQL